MAVAAKPVAVGGARPVAVSAVKAVARAVAAAGVLTERGGSILPANPKAEFPDMSINCMCGMQWETMLLVFT